MGDSTTTPIYTSDGGNNFANGALMGASLNKGNNDPALLAAMMNGGMGGQWNNPFVYLVWMMFANRWMGGNGYGNPNANTSTQAQIQALQNVVQDNHNSDLLMQAVNGNTTATQQLATALNAGFDQVNAAICGVRNGITAANGNIQLAAQQMISNNNLQSAALGNQICQGFNGVQNEILTQGYQGQLRTQAANYQNQINNLQQSNLIQSLSQQQNQLVSNGFTQIGFQVERQGCEIKEANLANTQRIIDTLNNHWSQTDQNRINSLESQLALSQQTQTILDRLNSSNSAARTATSAQ